MWSKSRVKYVIITLGIVLVIVGMISFAIFSKIIKDNQKLLDGTFKLNDTNMNAVEKTTDDELVVFEDDNLKKYILKKLNKSSDYKITISDMESFTKLSSPQYVSINSIKGLEYCTNLEELDLACNNISDISALKNLKKLSNLYISSNMIEDISALKDLKNLKELDISHNKISDISYLSGLESLEKLYAFDIGVSDISSLGSLYNLKVLNLDSNNISDISILGSLTKLEELSLINNYVYDATPLLSLESLNKLVLTENLIEDISKLSKFKLIEVFDISKQRYLNNNNEYVIKEENIVPENTIDTAVKLEFDSILFRNLENNYVRYEGKIAAIEIDRSNGIYSVCLNPNGDPYDGLYIEAKIKYNNEEEYNYLSNKVKVCAEKGRNFGVIGILVNNKSINEPIYFTKNYEVQVQDIINIFSE